MRLKSTLNSNKIHSKTIAEKRKNLWERSVKLSESSVSDIVTPLASTPSVRSKSKILWVDHIAWDDGCSPTSAAMILEYWGEKCRLVVQ
jgi:hypothetical protein